MTVDDNFVTLSNGLLISSQQLPGGKRVDHWKQSLPAAPYLTMMAVSNFKVVKELIDHIREKALGQEVMTALSPTEQVIKIMRDEGKVDRSVFLQKVFFPVLKYLEVTRHELQDAAWSARATKAAE